MTDRTKKKLLTNLKKEPDSNNFLRLLLRATVDYPQEIIHILNQITDKLTLPIWYMYLTCLAQLDGNGDHDNDERSSILANVLSVAPVLPHAFMEDISEDL